MKDSKITEKNSRRWGKDLSIFLLLLLGGVVFTQSSFVTMPRLREAVDFLKKELSIAKVRISNLENTLVRKDRIISAKDMQLQSAMMAKEAKPEAVVKAKPQYVKEPLTAQDSARIADIIYEKKPRETISLYDSLVIYNVFKTRADKGKIYSVPQQQLHDN
jgi:predicted nucleic acid-binding protein